MAAGVSALVTRVMGDTGLGKVVAAAAPVLIITIATFMILDQLKIAHNIVLITYAALLGAIALGSALAFGLGGREVAAELLRNAHDNVQQNKEQWKRDAEQGAAAVHLLDAVAVLRTNGQVGGDLIEDHAVEVQQVHGLSPVGAPHVDVPDVNRPAGGPDPLDKPLVKT